jgi:hypothetical protein
MSATKESLFTINNRYAIVLEEKQDMYRICYFNKDLFESEINKNLFEENAKKVKCIDKSVELFLKLIEKIMVKH